MIPHFEEKGHDTTDLGGQLQEENKSMRRKSLMNLTSFVSVSGCPRAFAARRATTPR